MSHACSDFVVDEAVRVERRSHDLLRDISREFAEESARVAQVFVPARAYCFACDGRGWVEHYECAFCFGQGYQWASLRAHCRPRRSFGPKRSRWPRLTSRKALGSLVVL